MTTETGTIKDSYARITARILTELEQGVTPWTKPWSAEALGGRVTRPLRVSGEPYRGINVILLWMEAVANGFASPSWMTYRQAKALGGQVRQGEHGCSVVYYGEAKRTEKGAQTGEEREEGFRFLKSYIVFNVAQIEGLPARFYPEPELPTPLEQQDARISHAEAFFESVGAEVRHGSDRAFYAVGADRIQLPPFEAFHDAHGYYATRAHETVHWTRHPSRLNRSFGRERWGDEGYAREELVAELGAAFLAADLGLSLEPRPDHAAYLASWIKVLQNDKRAIVQAASHAERASAFLHQLQNRDAMKAAA